MIKVIINADDLGLNPTVNSSIDMAMQLGFISSSTILANTEYMPEVKRIVSAHPDCSFGVHLNLTQGRCLCPTVRMCEAGIIDADNCFTHKKMEVSDADLIDDIKNEFHKQIETLIKAGIVPTHIDGHHHIHALYSLRHVVLDLCKEFGIIRVRSVYKMPLRWKIEGKLKRHSVTSHVVQGETPISNPGSSVSHSVSLNVFFSIMREKRKWRRALKREHISLTDYFDSYEHFYDQVRQYGIRGSHTVELMCHPGHPNYIGEYEMICQQAVDREIPLQLISYKQL